MDSGLKQFGAILLMKFSLFFVDLNADVGLLTLIAIKLYWLMHGGPQDAFKVGLIKCINN